MASDFTGDSQLQKADLPLGFDLQDAIRRRAEEIYVRSGKVEGHDLENWALAEAEILRESALPTPKRAVMIRVKGVQYVGEYDVVHCGDYTPGEFRVGADVAVRFDGDKMFVKRTNGSELETDLVYLSN